MRMETNFGATRAYTVGIEEEFQLVDPASHKLVPAIEAVLAAEQAIRAVNALSRHVPLCVALSANSPFWGGLDTRLASVRVKIFNLVPRSGLPPRFRSWEDFEGYVDALVGAGSIPDYSLCWWDVRPHPRLGTVELRAPDTQTQATRTASLAALAQCLVATA